MFHLSDCPPYMPQSQSNNQNLRSQISKSEIRNQKSKIKNLESHCTICKPDCIERASERNRPLRAILTICSATCSSVRAPSCLNHRESQLIMPRRLKVAAVISTS